MNLLNVSVVLALVVGTWAQVNVLWPLCDSPEAEEAALVAQDYLNAQHTHGYKYALNRIEDIKIYTKTDGVSTYVMEVDLLETDCHVLDPTPVANCTVRPKVFTAVEGDCDVVLTNAGGVMTVTAFKCQTDVSTEDICLGCPTLLPLNDTTALDFVKVSLGTYNNRTVNVTYTLLEVGRMSSKIVSGGLFYSAEYVVIEANCTDDPCVPLNDPMATRGMCTASGINSDHIVDCKMFTNLMPFVDSNSTAGVDPALPPVVHVHTGSLSPKHGLRHHKLTALHDPQLSGLLSAESAESAEVVPVAPAVLPAADPAPAVVDPAPAAADPSPAGLADPAPTAADPSPTGAVDIAVVPDDASSASDASNSREIPILLMKRDVPAAPPPAVVEVTPVTQTDPMTLIPACPGRIRFF